MAQPESDLQPEPPTPAVTLQDVARHAGVSLATASRSLNGSRRRVKEDYRTRVLAAAAELKYSPNVSAQAMARGRTRSVALVLSDITDPYFSAIAAGVSRAAEAAGLIVTLSASERRPERELEIVANLHGQKPQVLILVGSRIADDSLTGRLVGELKAFEAGGGLVALVSQEGLPFNTVTLENESGAKLLVDRLVGLGYCRFAVLAGPRDLLTARDRLNGIKAGLIEHGIEFPPDHIIHGDFTRNGGYAAAGILLEHGTDAQVAIAVNDVMAIGAMARLREAGLTLPEDISVAGFDDIVAAQDVTPTLTTVHFPLESAGIEALRLALESRANGIQVRSITGDPVIRQSTPPLP